MGGKADPFPLPLGSGLGRKREVRVRVRDCRDESGPRDGNVCCGNPTGFFWEPADFGQVRELRDPREPSFPASLSFHASHLPCGPGPWLPLFVSQSPTVQGGTWWQLRGGWRVECVVTNVLKFQSLNALTLGMTRR